MAEMKFLVAAVICGLLCTATEAYLTPAEFESFIDDTCFQKLEENDQSFSDNLRTLVNGQENPLASTMDNFISLAEKFEAANPSATLRDELFYFIRNYTYDYMEYTSLGDILRWQPKDYFEDDINKLWEPETTIREKLPEINDPFSDAEKCSLFFSIAYSVVRSPRQKSVMRSSVNNNTSWRSYRSEFNFADLYPLEQGVVSILGTESTVALGRVLRGLYVGLSDRRKRPIEEIKTGGLPKGAVPDGATTIVDPLYAVTVSEILALSTWRAEAGNREKMSAEGRWMAVPIGTNLDTSEVCPMVYKLPRNTSQAFSFNAFRGAADGLILGNVIHSVLTSNQRVKLSQVLRMYYSRGGLVGQAEEIGTLRATFCNRESFLQAVQQTIEEQIRLYIVLASKAYKAVEGSVQYAMRYYDETKESLFGRRSIDSSISNLNEKIKDYCTADLSVDNAEKLPLETPLDVVAVLDSANGEDIFKRQQLILGYLAKQLQLSRAGSQMTILTRMRSEVTNKELAKVTLKPVVENTHSSSCAACTVTQIAYESNGGAPEDEVIIAVDQLLQQKKENETRDTGVNGNVVLFFNFQEDQATGRPTAIQSRVTQALRDLHYRHIDATIYALGRNVEILKNYGRGDTAFVINAMDGSEKDIGDNLFAKVSQAPATIQFSECEDGRNEQAAVLEDYVSPNAIQHWEMPALYFHRSRNIKFTFEYQNGPFRVCHSRAVLNPELQKNTCQDVSSGNKAEFKQSNPCKGLTKEACSPFYFSILGINETETNGGRKDYCSDTLNSVRKCKTLDQIKFRGVHDGIRCSGAVSLLASAIMVYIGVLFSRFF